MAGKAQSQKGFGKKLKDQQDDNKTLYSLANQGTIMASNMSVISGGSQGGGSWLTTAMSDINMNTYDIRDVDRIFFATKIGAGDVLLNTDYGIEAAYLLGDAYGILHRVPADKQHIFMRGDDIIFSLNSDEIILNDDISVIGYEDMYKMTEPDSPPASWRRIFVNDDNSDHLSVKKSDGSVVDLEAGGGTGMQNPAVAQFDMATYSIEGNWDIGGGQTNFVNVDPTVGIEADLDMNSYDIKDVCRLGFELGGSALAANISGISASADRLHFNVPTGDYHYFTVNDDGRLKIDSGFMEIQDGIDIRNPTTTVPGTAGSGSTEVEYGDIHGWLKIQVDGGNYSIPVWALP